MVERDASLLRNRLRVQLKLNPEEDAIQFVVRDPELRFVRLTGPQARGRHLLDDLRQEGQVACHFSDLRLVQIPDWEEVRGTVPVEREVSGEELTLVPRAHDDASLRVRDEVQDDHPRAGPKVPAGDLVRLECQEPFLHGGDDRRNPDEPDGDTWPLREHICVIQTFPSYSDTIRHCDESQW